MAFVKLDCGILDSTLWVDRPAREVFVTALLMAIPYELTEPVEQFKIDSLETTGWKVPPGWYGFVKAASIGIIRRAGIEEAIGIDALIRLGNPEASSRSPDYEGRRMVRVEGGFIILNFQKYRDRDYTAADRARRYRSRKSHRDDGTSHRDEDVTTRNVTQAEAEAEEERNIDMPGLPYPVISLFELWKKTYNHPKAKLDEGRKKKIRAAMKIGYSVPELEAAIQGYKLSKFHMGENDRHHVFDGLELILRNAEHIDHGIRLWESRPKNGEPNGTDDPWQRGPNRGVQY